MTEGTIGSGENFGIQNKNAVVSIFSHLQESGPDLLPGEGAASATVATGW